MVITDDRVLILELKDFHGKLSHNGDQWIHNRRRFRSPVHGLAMKARKIKSFLQNQYPWVFVLRRLSSRTDRQRHEATARDK